MSEPVSTSSEAAGAAEGMGDLPVPAVNSGVDGGSSPPPPAGDDDSSAGNASGSRASSGGGGKKRKSSPAVVAARQAIEEAERDVEAAKRSVQDIEASLEAAKSLVAAAEARRRAAMDALEDAELREHCQWNTMYGKLLEYAAEHGDCLVPHGTPGDRELTSLGRWVANQRVFYKMHQNGKTGHIKPCRIRSLEKIGFVWNVNDMLWDNRLRELTEYKEENGTCEISTKDRGRAKLRKWVELQRQNYRLFRAKRTSTLTPERIQKLEDLGLTWRVGDDAGDDDEDKPKKKKRIRKKQGQGSGKKRRNTIDPSGDEVSEWWDSNYADLRSYWEEHGHCRMHQRGAASQRARQGTSRLRDFCSWQRKEYKKKEEGMPSEMTEERLEKLRDIGFEFVTNPRDPRVKAVRGQEKKEKEDGREDEAADGDGAESKEGEKEEKETAVPDDAPVSGASPSQAASPSGDASGSLHTREESTIEVV